MTLLYYGVFEFLLNMSMSMSLVPFEGWGWGSPTRIPKKCSQGLNNVKQISKKCFRDILRTIF